MSLPKFINMNVRTRCPECDGAVTTYDHRDSSHDFGTVVRDGNHSFQNKNFARTLYLLMCCAGCGRGGLATIHDNGKVRDGFVETFYPPNRETAPLPEGVPEGVVAEYREAELCASVDAWRGASALLRSTLEKCLRANGYKKESLEKRIDSAHADGILTVPLKQVAHENVRDLGNDVVHDDWRAITADEYASAHHYVQRILESFYDQRSDVEKLLKQAKRLPETAQDL